MDPQHLWKIGRAVASARDTPELYDRLIEEVRGEIKGQNEALVRTLVDTIVPVRAATIILFSFHLMTNPENVPDVIRAAASDEGHRHQATHAEAACFSELFTAVDVSWVPDGYFISTFVTQARSAEEVLSDLTEVPEGGVYFIENEENGIICSVVRTSASRYYHIYPHESGLLVAGPASLSAVCDSLVSVYPRSLATFQRFVVQKNVFRPYMRGLE